MSVDSCIFCKIVEGDLPSVKVWEDDDFLAILDINPNVEGATVLISKEHFSSNFLSLPEEVICDFTKAAKQVSKVLTRGLDAERVMLVAEGMDVNHAHLKLYPMNKESYLGYLSTGGGVTKTQEELEKVAEKIRGDS
jgi:histidine triad (HIT) family protein